MKELLNLSERDQGFVMTRIALAFETLRTTQRDTCQIAYFTNGYVDDIYLDQAMWHTLENLSDTIDSSTLGRESLGGMEGFSDTLFDIGDQGGFRGIVRASDLYDQEHNVDAIRYVAERGVLVPQKTIFQIPIHNRRDLSSFSVRRIG